MWDGNKRGIPRELVLCDWNWLHETGQLHRDTPLAVRIREAAPRMGMKPDALEKALSRAGIRNPVEDSILWRKSRKDKERCIDCTKVDTEVRRWTAHVHFAVTRLSLSEHSVLAKRNLAECRERLATAEAHRDWHTNTEHTDDADLAAA